LLIDVSHQEHNTQMSVKLDLILKSVANNQPRSNIELAGYWAFNLQKPNEQLYRNIQPARCWDFNSI